MTDDLTLLASAYLDDDVTVDERARVEADPEARAEVERLRTVRVLLGDAEAPSISTREAHLAAALDAWDRIPQTERSGARREGPASVDGAAIAGAASVTAPTPLNARRRRLPTYRLAGAAATLVLVLAGGVALQLGSASNDDSASNAEEATTPAESAARDAQGATADEPVPAGDAASELAAPESATESSELDTGISDVAPPGENTGLDQLRTLNDLADFAATAIGAPVAPDVPAATSAPDGGDVSGAGNVLADTALAVCFGVDLVVGPALYLDVPVVVGIDEGRAIAIAYQPDPCSEVARVPLP